MLGLRAVRPHLIGILLLVCIGVLSFNSLSDPRWINNNDEDNFSSTSDPQHLAKVHWKDDQLLFYQPPMTITVTQTQTEVQTETRTVSVEVPTPSPVPVPVPQKIPGPAFCDSCGPEDKLCRLYGEHNLALSRVYEGSNTRFRRVLRAAMRGEPVKIGVIGGSVSAGHGLDRRYDKWSERYVQAWRGLFPNSEPTFINGAVPATGSNYMSMCFGQHIDEDVDLVLVELFINDQRVEDNAKAYEWFMRGVMALPKSPAIVHIYTIGLGAEFVTTGGDLHTPVAEYYDAPIISIRNMLASHIYKNWELDVHYFGKTSHDSEEPDWRHVSLRGHEIMSDLLVAYTQRQICAIEKENAEPQNKKWVDTTGGKLPAPEGLGDIPRIRLFQKYDRTSVNEPVKPYCRSIQAKKYPLVPLESEGWEQWTPPQTPDKVYFRATEPGAWIKMEVIVGVMRRVRVTFLRSKTFGLGDAWCWVGSGENDDGFDKGKRIKSWWNVDKINTAFTEVVTTNAAPGRHVLTCKVMKETTDPKGGLEFRLISVDAS